MRVPSRLASPQSIAELKLVVLSLPISSQSVGHRSIDLIEKHMQQVEVERITNREPPIPSWWSYAVVDDPVWAQTFECEATQTMGSLTSPRGSSS